MHTLNEETPAWPAGGGDPGAGAEDGAASFDESGGLPAERPRVFISHKCDVEPDEQIAGMLYADLTEMGCDVYFDKAQPPGVRYDAAISDALKNADFVVALITRQSNESDWVKYELSFAAGGNRLRGRPVIIPVRLGFAEQYSAVIGASIGTINAISCEPGDYAKLLEGVKAGMGLGPSQWEPPPVVGMDGFLLKDFRKNLTRAATRDSDALRRACDALRHEGMLWVVGDSGVRNHFARTLAVREHDRAASAGAGRKVYEVPRTLGFAKVDDTLVRGAIITFSDVTPSALFDEEGPRDELKSLKNLAGRNTIIVTASEDAYKEIEQEMRNRDFALVAAENIGRGPYDAETKLDIFERVLDFSHKSGVVVQKQYLWARRLLGGPEGGEVFRPILEKWSPTDIERFITQHLRRARRQGDVVRLLQLNADLDNEIHAWFVALDDSTRCFVLALAMFTGLRREQFWDKYKLIVGRLKKLEAGLSLWPLGICRERAAPYVTAEGQLDFVDERIAEAVYREVAKNFREYLIELVPLMKELSVPPGRDQKTTAQVSARRKLQAAESRGLRAALARVTGKAGQQGLQDLRALLEFWGADPLFQVREAVALALEQAVAEKAGAKHGLGLLERWCGDASNRGESLYRAWAAASALAGIVAARPRGSETRARALVLLERLTGGAHASIKFYVSVALKKAARKVPLVEEEVPVTLEELLSLAAQDGKPATKINVAEALIEARVADEQSALGVIREWVAAEDADCRWAAMCSLLLWRRQDIDERNREIVAFLANDAPTAASVLVEILNHKHEKAPPFRHGLGRLMSEADGATRRALVSGLAALPQASLEERLLPLLRSSDDPRLIGLITEVRAERWLGMFSAPAEFIAELRKSVQQESTTAEAYSALAAISKPGPEGRRAELTQALASCFAECRAALDDTLTRLKTLAPSTFGSLCVEVRHEGLRRLLYDSPTLVGVAAEGLSSAALSGDTREALELLAEPEPKGSREAMLQALAHAQTLDAAPVRALLRQLRATGSSVLAGVTYEFNLRSLLADLSKPERFLSRITGAMREAQERAEVWQVLRQLSEPEPRGRRSALVRALGAVRVTRRAEVDALLREPSWQTQGRLFSLSTEIKLFSFLSASLSPRIAVMLFAERP